MVMCLLTLSFVQCISLILFLSFILLMKFCSVLYYLPLIHLVLSFRSGFLFLRLSYDFLGVFANWRKAIISFVISGRLSVRPHGKTRLLLNGFSRNLIFQDFSKIYNTNSSFTKIGREQRVLYRKTNIHFLSHLAHFFLEWEMFQTKVVEKIKTHICDQFLFFFVFF